MEILLFRLANETFCISVEYVDAIENMVPVTFVPKAKLHIAGLINIRGSIMPAVDMSKLLELDIALNKNKLILVRYGNSPIALIVDDVDDVISIDNEEGCFMTLSNGLSVINHNGTIFSYINEPILSKI